MPTFSIITPAYQAATTITDAIKSIQAQTLTDWEYLVVDDGSTDNTATIVNNISQQDNRIKLFSSPQNEGVSSARNLAMRNSSGDFLVFLDADDKAMPDRLEHQYKALLENPEIAAIGSAVQLFGTANNLIHPVMNPIKLAIHMLFRCEFFMTSIMMHRSVQAKRSLWFNPHYKIAEDWEFFSRLVRFESMANLPEVLTCYRRRDFQSTTELTDHSNNEAAKLRQNQLVWFGMPKNEIDIEAHIAVSPCYWPLKKDIPSEAFEINRVTNWINKLIAVNDKMRRFPSDIFRRILTDILENYRAVQ